MAAPLPSDRTHSATPRVCVFAPAIVLTVTIEAGADSPEVHLHVGGQGFWVARLVAELGVSVVLVAPSGGEVGTVLEELVACDGVELRACPAAGTNGAYVHDRRTGERVVIADMPPAPLSRHELDELYGAALVEGADADVCVLAGPGLHPLVQADVYERLAHDLGAAGATTVADLSGDHRRAALRGGLSVLKVATDELRRDGWQGSDADADIAACLHELSAAGAEHVVATRGERGALAYCDGRIVSVEAPPLQPVETRGAGDSLTAGLTAALARGERFETALRLGGAAGALNVTRRGLGSGAREDIERYTERVVVRPLDLEVS